MNGTVHLYDTMGVGYDTTRRADPYITSRLFHHLGVMEGGTYLDVACGTGNYTAALAAKGGTWHGIDQSGRMLQSARQKASSITWCQADTVALPFKDRTFSGALVTCAIHHFGSLPVAFQEVYRVMAPGRFVVFTDTHEQMRGYWLNEYFPQAMERSIAQMPDFDSVVAALSAAGFSVDYTELYEIQPDLQDLFLYSGKHRPEMYLSEGVRQGISTFALLADPAEVQTGCDRLRSDIASGRIARVMDNYRNGKGDYLFVVASKGH